MTGMLIADRDTDFCQQVAREILKQRRIPIKRVTTLEMALHLSERSNPSAVLIDMGIDSVPKALCGITQLASRSAVMATAHRPPVTLAVAALKAGAQDFIEKPCGAASIALWTLEVDRPCPHVLAERLDLHLRECSGDPSLSLTTFSKQVHISTSYASKLFSKYLHMSFRRRLLEHRVREATELLVATDDPMYQIAETCGFRAQSRLSEAFRRVMGESPRYYRRRHQRANSAAAWESLSGQSPEMTA